MNLRKTDDQYCEMCENKRVNYILPVKILKFLQSGQKQSLLRHTH